jgi:seryl-tRNA synthetase
MASTSETGHPKNVANFEDLITSCLGNGAMYNPSKAAIKLPALNSLFANAKEALSNVNSLLPAYKEARGQREAAFEPLSELITKIVNSAKASEISKQANADIKTIARKLQGKRATPKKQEVAIDPANQGEETAKSISSSQMSFDQRIENFEKLIQLLASLPNYAPNETELTVSELNNLLIKLRTKNTETINSYIPLSNSRINRDTLLYSERSGLVDIAGDVKSYIKSVFGAKSPQYKQVSGIKFTKRKL